MSSSPPPVRVLVMEDHERMRAAMVLTLESAGMTVVAETDSARDALRLAEVHRPDVAVLDVRIPDGNGIDVCNALRAAYPQVGCVIVTSHEDPGTRRQVAAAGATEFVLKTTRMLDLTDAVLRAVNGLELAAG